MILTQELYMQETGFTFSQDVYTEYKKNGDAELFEKLVADLILNKFSEDSAITEYISKLPRRDQRLAILSLIDKETRGDSNLIWSEMKSFVDSAPSKMEHIKDVIRIINKFVKDGNVEKKKFGEVLTPISLVKEMLDTLPQEVWSNPNLKWLDPCNGPGTFPFVVIYKLMNGLSGWEPDENKRYKHIVENMIYVCELQSRNVFLWLCGVDPYDEYTTNTYWGSFLDEGFDRHMREVWGLSGFDLIVGNPPFNKPGCINTGNTIWPEFVCTSLKRVYENGFLVMVHPSSWRKPENDLYKQMIQYKILHLDIHNTLDGIRVFGMGTRYDWYVLHKIKTDNTIDIVTEDLQTHKISLEELPFIPNKMISEIKKLISINDACLDIIYDRSSYPSEYIGTSKGRRWLSKENKDFFIHPVINNLNKSGLGLIYSSVKDKGHFGVPKVIVSASTGKSLLDFEGKYGMGRDIFGIRVDTEEEGKLIVMAISSKKFIDIINSIKWGNFRVEYKFFKYLKKDFYKYFIY